MKCSNAKITFPKQTKDQYMFERSGVKVYDRH